MKLRISKQHLDTGLAAVKGAVAHRTTLPILGNILLIAESPTKLRFAGTNLDLTVQCVVECTASELGSITVPLNKMMAISREIGDSEITLTTDDKHRLHIETGGSLFKLLGISSDNFPPLTQKIKGTAVEMSEQKLLTALTRVAFCASTDETRHTMNGVFLKVKAGQMQTIATDGRRLSLYTTKVDVPMKLDQSAIIPSEAIKEVMRHLEEDDEGEVSIMFGTTAMMSVEITHKNGFSVLIATRLIDGEFPNYEQVIPAEDQRGTVIPVHREILAGAVRRAALLTTEINNSVKLQFAENSVTVSANGAAGSAVEVIDLKYTDTPKSTAFNPKYLTDVLDAIPHEEITLRINDAFTPAVIETDSHLYVCMPVRLDAPTEKKTTQTKTTKEVQHEIQSDTDTNVDATAA